MANATSRSTSTANNPRLLLTNRTVVRRDPNAIVARKKDGNTPFFFGCASSSSSSSRAAAAGPHRRRRFASSSSSSSSSAKKEKKGFVEWYEGHLESRPVTTKAITGSILWGVGDAVAQLVPPYFSSATEEDAAGTIAERRDDGTEAAAVASSKREFEYDLPRTARAVAFGFALHAPLSHLHFNFLERMTVRGGFRGLSVPVFKTVMEQFVYWSWISNSLYHGAMGAMQGMNPTQVYDRVADVLWDTQVAQWTFWIPVQLLNFQFVPVRHQLNVVLLTSIAWTALLSAWYPPEEKEEAEEENDE